MRRRDVTHAMEPTFPTEPTPTAIALAVGGVLVAIAVLLSRTMGRRGIPVVLFFMVVGMLAGSEGIGGLHFESYTLAFRVGTVALVFILFDGGLHTSFGAVRKVLLPASVLATLGVALTAGLVAVAGRLVGLELMEALLLGAVVSSTDAAAVFSVLRSSGVHLRRRVAGTLELESGLNDPMAVILTFGMTQAIVSHETPTVGLLADVLLQLGIGAAFGLAFGFLGRWTLRLTLLSGSFYPVLTLALACLAFAVPTLFSGSGFLAVYVAGIVLGNGPLPYRTGILRAHDFVAWSSQVLMFLMLGLLAYPSRLAAVIGPGLIVSAILAFVARPVSVLLCVWPFRYQPKEVVYMSWVGLRGAVPIILGMFPMIAGIEGAPRIFNIVFFVVVVSALVQGWSVPSVTRLLGLKAEGSPAPPTVLEIDSVFPLADEVMSFYVGERSGVRGKRMQDLTFPEGAAAMLVVRGRDLIAPRGRTELEVGDHVYVFSRPQDRDRMHQLFGPTPPPAA